MTEPEMLLDAAKQVVAAMTAPKVTEESIKAKIADVQYVLERGTLTLCILTMRNGFYVVGISAPASPANFDSAVGERYAYENAFRQLWPLEGYLLKERLWEVGGSEQAEVPQVTAGTGYATKPDVVFGLTEQESSKPETPESAG